MAHAKRILARKLNALCCCCNTENPNMDCEERLTPELDPTSNDKKNDMSDDSDGEMGRNKVALLPGFSLMDWIRLGNAGQDLTGVGGAILEVTEEELMDHCTQDDAWISIRGNVYNVTPYMGFHPGGIPELMKGIGTDATKLFMEIHPWVNYESILRKCFVGHLVRKRTPRESAELEEPVYELVEDFEAGCTDDSIFESDIKMIWCQTSKFLKFTFYLKSSSPHVVIHLKGEKHLRVLIGIKRNLHVFGFKLERKVLWPCVVTMNTDTGKLNVDVEKREEDFWKSYGENDEDHGTIAPSTNEIDTYHSAEIISLAQVTHDVRIFVFRFLEKVIMWTPIGHDIRIRGIIEGIDYAKQYTPVPPHLPHGVQSVKHWHHNYICCLIKYYKEGALTPYLFAKEEHDIVEIGAMSGRFNIRRLRNVSELYLIAAGSGISPMLRLIVWAVAKKRQVKSLNLLYLNRNEEDIIWRKELNELSKKEKWFKVIYVLSNPTPEWTGLKGRVNERMLRDFLPSGDIRPDELPEFYICVCGPIQFVEMVQKYLIDRHYDKWSHCFF